MREFRIAKLEKLVACLREKDDRSDDDKLAELAREVLALAWQDAWEVGLKDGRQEARDNAESFQ